MALLVAPLSATPRVLFFEGFDYAENGVAPSFDLSDETGATVAFFGEATSFDYLGIFDGAGDGGADFGADAAPTSFNAYAGFDDNYLAGSDIDGGAVAIADPTFLTWSDVSIADSTRIRVSAALATEDDDNGLDPSDFVRLEFRVDGGDWRSVLAFETADAVTSNQTTFLLDTDADGVGDGAALTDFAQTFSTEIDVAGASLDLRLAIRVEAAFEDIAVDAIEIVDLSEPVVGETFLLQLLHASDLEGGVDAIDRAPNFAAIVDALEDDAAAQGWASILLSAGDNYLPGPFAGAAADASLRAVLDAVYETLFPGADFDIRESIARIDLTIMNVLGFDASAIGNHEFDFGSAEFLANLVNDDARGGAATRWLGAQFPYLSTNLDFSAIPAPTPTGSGALVTNEILSSDAFAPAIEDFATVAEWLIAQRDAPKIAQATTIERGGELIGVIGATTQRLPTISSPNPVTETTSNGTDDMAALAAALQPVIDDLIDGADNLAGNADDVNKVILVSHLQDINLEKQLAGLLRGVDIIVAGGSDTRLADETDRLRASDVADGDYPFETVGADGGRLLIVSTDGEYSYVGRLVVEFDANGRLVNFGGGAEAVDAGISGAFATDDEGVTDVTGAETAQDAVDASTRADLVERLVDAVSGVVTAQDAVVFGRTAVFIEGRRELVRTQQTTLGDLTADANLAYAKSVAKPGDAPVVVSIKNGGGIRAAIGEVDGLTGELLPTAANPVSGKLDGEISQLDIVNSLRFNNGLTLLTLNTAQLAQVLENAVASSGPGATPGQFAQVSGLRFSFDDDMPVGDRIQNAGIFAEDGALIAAIVRDGAVVDNGDATFRIVTLNFLANGGDGYPFPNFAATSNRVDLTVAGQRDGEATFADAGTEQDAFAEYLARSFATTPFTAEEAGPEGDDRIQNLDFRADAVFEPALPPTPVATRELGPIGIAQVLNSGAGEGGSEVVAFAGGRLFTTNGATDAIDVWDLQTGARVGSIDLSFLPGFESLQSLAVRNNLIAVAVAAPDVSGAKGLEGANGYVALIDARTLRVIDRVTVGNLPDALAFTPDGTKIVVADEGEFNAERGLDVDPAGSISIIDVSNPADPKVVTLGFDGVDVSGLRLAPGAAPLNSIEPEYVAISADGTRAFVTLQEANGVAVVDLITNAIIDVIPLGTVDHDAFGFELDPNDDGLIGIGSFADLVGLRMPDAIATFTVDGATFLITANEGDGRGSAARPFGDEARVQDILDGDIDGLSIDPTVNTSGLERLVVSTIDGDTDSDGDIDVLHAFGSRSFTIFAEDGSVVFDSGSQFELILADIAATRFNNDDGEAIGAGDDDNRDNRSDAKGPEPEAVAVGQIGDQLYAFIGLERDSGVMIYNITDPTAPVFADYIDGFANGGVGPETITFIPAFLSASGAPQIAVAYEINGVTIVYDIGALPRPKGLNEMFDDADGFEIVAGGTSARPRSFFSDGVADYFGLTGGAVVDFGGDAVPSAIPAYDGADGSILVAQDLDGESGPNTIELAWRDIDISGFAAIQFLGDFAEGLASDGANDIDAAEFIRVEAAIDGGVRQTLLLFTGTQTNGLFRLDTDGDGIGDGAALGASFATFTTTLAQTGASLDLFLTALVEAGDEDFAADNFIIQAGVDQPADFNLQVTEIWFGQDGADLTADWFEITNFGTEAWTVAEGGLFYDDDSKSISDADAIRGIETIAAGESVIVMVGQGGDVTTFRNVWGPVVDLSNVQVGFTDGAGLGAGGDAVSLFIDGDTGLAGLDVEAFPAGPSGRSWDVGFAEFSAVGALDGVVATLATAGASGAEPAIGSPGLIPTEPPALTLISAIQGSSDFSALPGFAKVGRDDSAALLGQIVTIQAIVTADFQGATGLNGFFVQEEDADADGDAFTSEGLFVFDGPLTGAPNVAIGDLVRITGTVQEFGGQTQLRASAVDVIASNQLLPTATVIDLGSTGVMLDDDAATDYVANLEFVEGMRVTFQQTLTLTEMFNLDRFGEYRVTADGRPVTFTQDNAPSKSGFDAHLQDVAARSILLDDGSGVQNPFTIEIIDGDDGVLSASDSFRMGDTLTDVTGVVAYSFDEFRINDGVASYAQQNARPAAPQDVGGNFKLASLNVLNYFTTLDTNVGSMNGPNTSGPNNTLEPRGANTTAELDRQAQKTVNAIVAMDADVLGLIELENDDDIAIADLVSRVNAELGSTVYAFIPTGDVGTDAITTGIIYKIATVEPVGAVAILSSFNGQSFVDPLGAGSQQNRPAVAQTFRHIETGETMTVAVNHLKSKGSSTGVAADNDQFDGQGASNATRAAAAEILADWLASDPTGQGAENQLIIGDLNAYAQEDPITALQAAGFTDVAGALLGGDAYSFVFDGQIGTLDYVLANGPAFDKVTGVTEWHVNADEADAIDYNIDIVAGVTRDPALFDGETPARNSDHDPVIVGFELTREAEPVLVAGTSGNDTLLGTEADELFRGLGGRRDVIETGDGADTIEFGAWVVEGQRGTTLITDFDAETDDVVLVDGAKIIDWRETAAGLTVIFTNNSTATFRDLREADADFLPTDDALLV